MGVATVVLAGVLGAGLGYHGTYHTDPDVDVTAFAELHDGAGKPVGDVELTQLPHGVLIRVKLWKLPPGIHGFHVLERGQCEPSFASGGRHWNPLKVAHGLKRADGPHAGDLPNISIPESGHTEVELFTTRFTLHGAALYPAPPVFDRDGAAFALSATPDDYMTEPDGRSGPPIACGVLRQ